MSEIEQSEVVQAPKGPGLMLRQAREKLGLSVQDIATKIHLKSTLIEELEQDEYQASMSLTFIRGYLKLYAKQVGVSQGAIMNVFEQANMQEKEPAKLQSFSRRVANQANDDKLMYMTYAILALVLALVVMWWMQRDSNQPTSTNSLGSELSVTNQDEKNSLNEGAIFSAKDMEAFHRPVEPVVLSRETTESKSSEPVQELEVLDDKQMVQADKGPEVLATPVTLVFEFSGDCWMNLTDATGEAIAYGIKVAGRVMEVSGIPPFEVTLGAPDAVKIAYAGEALDMSRFKAGSSAKFTLPFGS